MTARADFVTPMRYLCFDMDANTSIAERQIAAAREGRADALANLLDAYRNYLRLLARTGIDASLAGKADPSDLVQEVMLKAHERFGQFRGQTEAELAAWLRQILARCLADLVRRYRQNRGRNVGRERSLDSVVGESAQTLGLILAASISSPSQTAQARELGVVLADVLAELPEDYRDVIILRSVEEREWDDVAKRMGRTAGAVRILWARALKRLRPLIEARL